MSEDLHDIDKLFKESIEEHAEAPPARVWEQLDKELDHRRVAAISGRYNMLKWVAAALFLISVGMAMWVYHLRTQQPENHLVKNSGADRHTGILSSKQTQTAQTQKLPSANNKDNSARKQLTIADSDRNGAAPVSASPHSDSTTTKAIAREDQAAAPEKLQPQSIAQQAHNRTVQAMKDEQLQAAPANEADDKKALANGRSKTNLERSPATAANTKSGRLSPEERLAAASLRPATVTGPRLHDSAVVVSLLPRPVLLTPLPGRISSEVSDAPIHLAPVRRPAFTATVFFSPNLVSSTVTNDSRVPYSREDEKNEIKAKEQNGSSRSIGALLSYNFNEHWSIGSGLVVSSRVTEIKTKTIYARPDPRGGGIRYRFNCSSGYSYIDLKTGGSNPFNGDSAKAMSSVNKLQYLSVPLIATYSFGGGKLRFLTSAGVQANLLTVRKIETFIAKGSSREYTNTSDIQGLRPVYLSGIVSAGASYNLNRLLTASVVPTAQVGFMSISQHAPVKSYINFYGLAMGLSVKL